jgi:hypothetical protein
MVDMPIDLQARFERMLEKSRDTGDGGREILETGYHTLAAGKAMMRWPDVGLEDLWAHALKEGRTMFNDPNVRWGKTGPKETADMLGQTTIGPWQMTLRNVQKEYGPQYGVRAEWTPGQVFEFCQKHPQIQAGMICDYIQISYSTYGTRAPYAIQRYFWLAAFVTGEIGQGPWDASVLPKPPDGDWTKLTAEMKRNTGFYAKQILLGTEYNPRGLLYWLWVNDDHDGLQATLQMWADQRDGSWDEANAQANLIGRRGRFHISVEDLQYVPEEACKKVLAKLIEQTKPRE